jgi:hypothetical protein
VLDPNHGPLFEIVLANRRGFIDFLVLQLVDSVYSLLRPDAWALQINNRACTLQIMAPLRDALGRITPLTESACRCIVKGMECQKWRHGLTENHVFVSSIDPLDWKSFLTTGQSPVKSQGTFIYSCSIQTLHSSSDSILVFP